MKIQVILLFGKIDKVFFGKLGHMKRLARSGTICTIYKKRKKYPWNSVTFSKFLVTFSQLFSGTKSCNAGNCKFVYINWKNHQHTLKDTQQSDSVDEESKVYKHLIILPRLIEFKYWFFA